MRIKTLSLIQPWASLIMLGMKRYETRSWATAYRGPILIHSSVRPSPDGRRLWQYLMGHLPPFIHELRPASMPERYEDLPFGQILCRSIIDKVIPTNLPIAVSSIEQFLGDFTPGRFAWQLGDVERVWPHVPAKGALGLWEFDLPEEAGR